MKCALLAIITLFTMAPACGAQTESVTPLARRINIVDSAVMVRIPAGEFIMGSDSAELVDIWKRYGWDPQELQFTRSEQLAHRVRVDAFWMYTQLVSVARYRRFVTATGREMPPPSRTPGTDNHPVVRIRWADGAAYCAWAGARLPYEAEWEHAARAGNTGLNGRARTVFIWGDSMPRGRVANLADESFIRSGYYDSPAFHYFRGYDDGHPHTSPVDAYPPNGYGIHDLAGNILEWMADWHSPDYYRNSPSVNPRGPAAGTNRVLRGGAFDTTPTITRIARRLGNDPTIQHDEKGFRCVAALP